MNCNVCGSANLIKGTIYDTGSGGTSRFVPDETATVKKWFGMGGREIQSYGCVHCGNLQFFIDFSDSDRQRHIEFLGQPPSVTEDLGADE